EGVPADTARALQAGAPVLPFPRALEVSQDRLVEKNTFRELGIATAPYRAVDDRAALDAAIGTLGLPAVLKTRRGGYDGKGQVVHPAGARSARLRGRVLHRAVRRQRGAAGQRDGAPRPQQWPLDDRRRRDQPVREPSARGPRLAARLDRAARCERDDQLRRE